MFYADSNFIFLLYKELSGKSTDISIYYDFFMEPKNVGLKFKDKHIWPKDQTWYTHIYDTYQNADVDFEKFSKEHISSTIRNKFISYGKIRSSDEITLSSVIYIRFLHIAKNTWNNNRNLLKKFVISYCHYYRLNPDFISALKKLSYEDIIYQLILEASSTRGEGRPGEQNTPNPILAFLPDTQTEAEWLKEWLRDCKFTNKTKECHSLTLKWIARYHFLKNKLLSFSADSKEEWEKALFVIDEFIAFVTNMLDLYIYYLPEISSVKFDALPKALCYGDEYNFPAFLGELYLIKSTLLINVPKSSNEITLSLHLNHAKKCLLDAEEILSRSLKMEEYTNKSKNYFIEPLLGKVFLNRVHFYCRLVTTEDHECRMEDLCQEYLDPCKKALLQARKLLDTSTDEYQNAKNEFITTFFAQNTPTLQRVVLPEESDHTTTSTPRRDLQNYIACADSMNLDLSWLHTFQFKSEKNSTYLPHAYKTVYSADFDSVLSPNLENSWKLELSIFQIIASGITIVLQLNQITDNIAMLKLLHNPSFQALCRKGMIVLSCYGDILVPRDYLYDALTKDIKSFEFSSSIWFNHPKFGQTYRNLMYQCLTENITYAKMMSELPDMIKHDLDFCYDSYRLLLELFPPSMIRQYHQNPKIRHPHMPLTKGNFITLNNAIDSRIKDLREDNDFYPIPERLDFLDFCTIQQNKALQNGYTTRSEYRNLLPEKEFLKQMTPQYQNYWNWFESLVNYAYCISNGSRSSDHIYNTLTHDILRLHPEQSIRNSSSTDNLIINDAYTRYRNDNISSWQMSNLMSMEDLLEISMTVREHYLQTPDTDKCLAQIESNTGMKYDSTKSGDALLVKFGYNRGNGAASEVSLSKNSTQTTSQTKDGVEIRL